MRVTTRNRPFQMGIGRYVHMTSVEHLKETFLKKKTCSF